MNKKIQEEEALAKVEKSNEIHAQIYSKDGKVLENQDSSDVKTNVSPVDADVKDKQPEPVKQDSNIVEPAKVDDSKKSKKQVDKKTKQSSDFEQKYSVLQNKYNAEVPRYASQLKEKEDEIKKLKDLIVDISKEQPKGEPKKIPEKAFDVQPASTTATEVEVKPFDIEVAKQLKPEDKSDFGAEWVDLVIRGANEVVDLKLKEYNPKIIDYINSRIRQIEQKLASINLDDIKNELKVVKTEQAQTAEEKYISYLNEHCSGWDTVRDTNEFAEWLGRPSPESGYLRKDLLLDAHSRLDAGRVALLYNAFMKTLENSNISNENFNKPVESNIAENVVATEVTEEPTIPVKTVQEPQFKAEIGNYIEPSRSVAGNVSVGNNEPVPSYDEIAKAQKQLRAGTITIDQFNNVVRKVTNLMSQNAKR